MQVSIDIFIHIYIYSELNAFRRINFIIYTKLFNLLSFNFEIFIEKIYVLIILHLWE